MKKFFYENGLSLIFFGLFLLSVAGQAVSGHRVYNEELAEAGQSELSFADYLSSGHFGSALFENWESEFLQMGLFVWLTIYFRQKGSSESKPLGKDPEPPYKTRNVPWPVRQGGLVLKVYEHSLSASLFLLFLASFAFHAATSLAHSNAERLVHGQPPEQFGNYIAGSQFWFESLQNWQSEFLSVFALVLLSIAFREKGSSQSKPVDATYAKTGE
jgi:hypothetical protein